MNSKRFEDTFWKERLTLTGVTDEDLKKRHGELERQLREAEIHVDAFFAAVEEKFGSEVACCAACRIRGGQRRGRRTPEVSSRSRSGVGARARRENVAGVTP